MTTKKDQEFALKVDRNVYPGPEYRHPDAKISTTYVDSIPDFPPPLTAPEGSPNILLVLIDDMGFGAPSVTGGPCNMPAMQKIHDDGLLYNRRLKE